MPEATIVCVDNSEYMRNGDFAPTRLDAQRDACNMLCRTKLRSHPENTIGMLTMSKREVISTLTNDVGKVLTGTHSIKAEGTADFLSAVQVAQLILKHRETKTHRQRIVVFVGSPIIEEEAKLVKLAKKLKKSNISVDVVNFGEEDANQAKLEAFINTVNKEDASHLVTVPSGSGQLSDSILASPVLAGDNSNSSGAAVGAPSGAAGADFSEYGGIDPSADPELAMAMRISLEEERRRQQQQEGGEAAEGTMETNPDTANPQVGEADEDELQAALAMSMAGAATGQQEESTTSDMPTDLGQMSEEQQLEYALRMSMAADSSNNAVDDAEDTAEEQPDKSSEEPSNSMDEMVADPAFFSSVLGSLPGVDPNDAQIQEVLRSMGMADDASSNPQGEKKEEDKS